MYNWSHSFWTFRTSWTNHGWVKLHFDMLSWYINKNLFYTYCIVIKGYRCILFINLIKRQCDVSFQPKVQFSKTKKKLKKKYKKDERNFTLILFLNCTIQFKNSYAIINQYNFNFNRSSFWNRDIVITKLIDDVDKWKTRKF